VASLAQADRLARLDDRARELAQLFWPGPLTLVVPLRHDRPDTAVSPLATAGLDTVALRLPDHPVARALIEAADLPVAAPSANRSGAVTPTDPRAVLEELGGRVALILADGRSPIGLESTVLDPGRAGDPAAPPRLLRPGGLPEEDIARVIGPVESGPPAQVLTAADRPRGPGLAGRHYAPRTPLRLDAGRHESGEALLTFGPDLRQGPEIANLSPDGDLVEAAANLFHMLRRLDGQGWRAIAVSPIPDQGLGRAINDRLARAALPPPADQ
jgi:L-threonylcarbamoyladenylate synthase